MMHSGLRVWNRRRNTNGREKFELSARAARAMWLTHRAGCTRSSDSRRFAHPRGRAYVASSVRRRSEPATFEGVAGTGRARLPATPWA
jgi:hypothetical protein